MKRIIAIIPAKKNSFRFKNKNLFKFKGKSLVEKTAIDALNSKYLHRVYLSTDSDKIRSQLKKYKNIHLLNKRSKKFSGRQTTMHSVIKHELKKIKIDYDFIMILQPTSPLRETIDIDHACKLMLKKKQNADCLVSTSELPDNYHTKKIMINNGKFIQFIDLKAIFLNNILINDSIKLRDQFKFKHIINENRKLFFRNGAIYIISKKKVGNFLIGGKIINYVMPYSKSLDINTNADIQILNSIYS